MRVMHAHVSIVLLGIGCDNGFKNQDLPMNTSLLGVITGLRARRKDRDKKIFCA